MKMLSTIYKYPILSLIVASILLFYFNLAELPVSIMEARNFNVAREMLTEGNWLLTTMNGLPRYEKPPFPAWFTTLFSRFNLSSVWLYRLPTSLMATLGVLFSYALFKTLGHHKKLAVTGALILATSFYYIVIRFEAPSDTYTHVAMIGGLLFLAKAMNNFNIVLNSLLAIILFAISVLSKGPVSLYTILLPFLIAYFISFKPNKKTILICISTVVFGTLIGSLWYIYVRMADPLVFNQIASEETSNWSSYHVRPFYYYWSFVIQAGIWTIPAAISLAYPYFMTRVENKKLYKLSWVWTIIAVILLSIIPEKKSRYLVPVLFPLALNIAQIIYHQFKIKKLDLVSKCALKLHYIILFIIGLSVVAIPIFINQRTVEFWFWYYSYVGISFGISAFIFFNYNPLKVKQLFVTNLLIIFAITNLGTYGIKFMKANENYKTLASAKIQKPIYYYKSIEPEIIWESNTISTLFDYTKKYRAKRIHVIVEKSYTQEFENQIASKYTVTSKEVFDRNYFNGEKNKKYRERYILILYKLKLKANAK